MSEWIRIERGTESLNIRPRVLDKMLSLGWTIPGADQETPKPKADGGLPKPRTRKKQ